MASSGQNSKIIGRVFLDDTEGCDACIVRLLDSKGLNLISFKYSDKNGNFRLKDLKHKDYKLNIHQFGYQDTTLIISSDLEGTNYITVSLKQLSFAMDEISIVDKVALLKKSGDTTTFNLKLLKKGNELTTTDIVQRIPGMNINNEKISYHGKTIDKLFIDKIDLSDENHTSLTDNISFDNIKNIKIVEHYNQYNSYEIDSTELGVAMLISLKDDIKHKPQISLDLKSGYKNVYYATGSFIKLSKQGGLRIYSGVNNTDRTINKYDKSRYVKSVQKDLLFNNRFMNIHQGKMGQENTFTNENPFEKSEVLTKIIATRNFATLTTLKSTNNIYKSKNKSDLLSEKEYFVENITMNENVMNNNHSFKITSNNELKSSFKNSTLLNIYFPLEIDKNIEDLKNSLFYNSSSIGTEQNINYNNMVLNPHYNLDYKKEKLSIQLKGRIDYSKLDKDNLFSTEDTILLRDFTQDSLSEFSQRIIYENTTINQQVNIKRKADSGYIAYNASITHSSQNLNTTSPLMNPEYYEGSDSLINFNTIHAIHGQYDTRKMRFHFGINYHYMHQNYDHIKNKNYGFSPYLFAMLKINSKWNISSSYKNAIVQPNIRQISPLWVIGNLQTLHSGNPNSLSVGDQNTLNVSIFRNFETGEDTWQFNTNLSYVFPYNAIVSVPKSSNNFVLNENVPGSISDNYNFSTYIGRHYRNFNFSLRSNMGYNTTVLNDFSYSKFFGNLSSSIKYRFQNFSLHSTCAYNVLDIKHESFEIKTRTISTNSRIFHEFGRVKHALGLKVLLNSNDQTDTLFPILSYSCKYIPKNSQYEISFAANNFLNFRNSRNTSINNSFNYSELTEYRVLPGNILIGVKFFL